MHPGRLAFASVIEGPPARHGTARHSGARNREQSRHNYPIRRARPTAAPAMLMLGGPAKRAADGAPARQQQPQRVMGVRQHPLGTSSEQQSSSTALGGQQVAAARAAAPMAAASAASTEPASSGELVSAKASTQAARTTRSRARQQTAGSIGAAPLTIDVIGAASDSGVAQERVAAPARAIKTRKLAPSGVLPSDPTAVACDADGSNALSPTGLLSVSPQQLRQMQQTPPPAATPSDEDSKSSSPASSERRVRFAPGPLEATPDGHPATEGCIARPVRHNICPGWGQDLTRGNVLLLESLLGAECQESVLRLKRRVGLLPLIRPPRPHASSKAPSPTRAATAKTVKKALLAAKAAAAGGSGKELKCAAEDVGVADQGMYASNGVMA